MLLRELEFNEKTTYRKFFRDCIVGIAQHSCSLFRTRDERFRNDRRINAFL